MTISPLSAIIDTLPTLKENYHRLVFLVGPPNSGKTAILQELEKSVTSSYLNLNLVLSKELLELSDKQRPIRLQTALMGILDGGKTDLILIDNIELLFDITLKQDPMRLFKYASRNKTLVISWNGKIFRDHIIYATEGHSDYRRYPIKGFHVIEAN